MFKKRILPIAKIVIGIGLLVFLFYQVQLKKLWRILKTVDLIWLLSAFSFSTLAMLSSIYKLHQILRETSKISFYSVFRAYYLGTFFNNFIPTSIGGDVVKVGYLNQEKDLDVIENSSAIFLERSSGIFVLGIIAFVVSLLSPNLYKKMGAGLLSEGKTWIILILFALALFIITNLFIKRSQEKQSSSIFTNFWNSLNRPLKNPELGGIIVLYSLLFHLIRALVFTCLSLSIGIELGYYEALSLLPIIAFITFLPVSFGGIGLREGVITFCLGGLGIAFEATLAIALLFRLFTFIHSLMGAGLYFQDLNK